MLCLFLWLVSWIQNVLTHMVTIPFIKERGYTLKGRLLGVEHPLCTDESYFRCPRSYGTVTHTSSLIYPQIRSHWWKSIKESFLRQLRVTVERREEEGQRTLYLYNRSWGRTFSFCSRYTYRLIFQPLSDRTSTVSSKIRSRPHGCRSNKPFSL